jgi:four helix bundle protein
MRQVSIALGSIAELETQLYIAQQLHYGESAEIARILDETDRLGKQLRSLMKSLHLRISKSKTTLTMRD